MPVRIERVNILFAQRLEPGGSFLREKFVGVEQVLSDDRFRRKPAPKDRVRKGDETRRILRPGTERRRRPDAVHLRARDAQARVDAPQKARQVRPLSPVERVKLVDDNITQRPRLVLAP